MFEFIQDLEVWQAVLLTIWAVIGVFVFLITGFFAMLGGRDSDLIMPFIYGFFWPIVIAWVVVGEIAEALFSQRLFGSWGFLRIFSKRKNRHQDSNRTKFE